MSDTFDLNIENYNLDDILHLFKLPIDFTLTDVKKAKKQALMTHPDRSGLDSKFFLFYVKAYHLIHAVYKSRNHVSSCTHKNSLHYSPSDIDIDFGLSKDIIDEMSNKEDFNKWFNKIWDKAKPRDSEDAEGYGEWLSSNQDLEGNSENDGERVRQKTRDSQLVKFKIPNEHVSTNNGVDILQKKPVTYSSDSFKDLQYSDVKEVYTETMIGVSDNDYTSRTTFRNVDELMRHRRHDDNIYAGKSQEKKFQNIKAEELRDDTNRLYELAKQDEQNLEHFRQGIGSLRMLRDKH